MKDLIYDQDRFRDQNLKAVETLEKDLQTVLNEKDNNSTTIKDRNQTIIRLET